MIAIAGQLLRLADQCALPGTAILAACVARWACRADLPTIEEALIRLPFPFLATPSFGMERETATSVAMLCRGATLGMVVQRLTRQGLPKHKSVVVAESACDIVRGRRQVVHVLIALAGALMIAMAALFFFALRFQGWLFVKLPICLTMIGFMMALYGLLGALGKRN